MRGGRALGSVAVMVAVVACSSSEQPSPGGMGGADNVGGSGKSGGAPAIGGSASTTGGSLTNGGTASKGGSSAEVKGPSCPDGITAVILEDKFPMPTAACAQFVEQVCPGVLDECAHHWCGNYFACSCQCAMTT